MHGGRVVAELGHEVVGAEPFAVIGEARVGFHQVAARVGAGAEQAVAGHVGVDFHRANDSRALILAAINLAGVAATRAGATGDVLAAGLARARGGVHRLALACAGAVDTGECITLGLAWGVAVGHGVARGCIRTCTAGDLLALRSAWATGAGYLLALRGARTVAAVHNLALGDTGAVAAGNLLALCCAWTTAAVHGRTLGHPRTTAAIDVLALGRAGAVHAIDDSLHFGDLLLPAATGGVVAAAHRATYLTGVPATYGEAAATAGGVLHHLGDVQGDGLDDVSRVIGDLSVPLALVVAFQTAAPLAVGVLAGAFFAGDVFAEHGLVLEVVQVTLQGAANDDVALVVEQFITVQRQVAAGADQGRGAFGDLGFVLGTGDVELGPGLDLCAGFQMAVATGPAPLLPAVLADVMLVRVALGLDVHGLGRPADLH
ncbi:hypothetical protein D9M68_248270 [compost metagenome]